ncbi:MAPEG family protein [Pseudooceanicola sp. CBS1P-1]|uniref:MAPEG family protein n=1 Tax=Pseudooceanicola albus TaxID=2692189 RepID=A0A6L7G2N4_9RHOB|nr:MULTISPECIES: MAPEG family protein [Pseudooceanicola]MBT9384817.1 MAPEG family protein [Pseudooceanicola endophyticus]MXN18189.1 MAPEG family protein [Pseudooceanicola albus]
MTPELLALSLVALEHVVLVVWSQRLLTRDVGEAGNTGPRDDLPPLSQDTQRMRRALANHTENFPFFIGAITVVSLSQTTSLFTALAAFTYVAARALYIPAYRYGWTPWRSVLYMLGALATIALYLAAFL